MSNETTVYEWCRKNELLAEVVKCPCKVKNGKNDDGRINYMKNVTAICM